MTFGNIISLVSSPLLINSSENRQKLEILGGDVKEVLPLLLKSSRKQAVTPLTAWIQLNSNLGF